MLHVKGAQINMNRLMLKSKIHGAIVTDANIEYEGSVTVDGTLMEKANLIENEHVVIWNVTNGSRVETYVINGKPDSGVVCANGAAAHHIRKGDKVIIASFAFYDENEVRSHKPLKVFVDGQNRIKS